MPECAAELQAKAADLLRRTGETRQDAEDARRSVSDTLQAARNLRQRGRCRPNASTGQKAAQKPNKEEIAGAPMTTRRFGNFRRECVIFISEHLLGSLDRVAEICRKPQLGRSANNFFSFLLKILWAIGSPFCRLREVSSLCPRLCRDFGHLNCMRRVLYERR